MPNNEFNLDMQDIRFVLYEHLPFDKLIALDAFSHLDKEAIDLVLDECAKFSAKKIAPINRSGDRQGCKFENNKVSTPQGFTEAYRNFCENGWLSLSFPEEIGGGGLPYLLAAITGEINIGACCSLTLSMGLTQAAAELIESFGSQKIKKIYLPKLISGKWQGTMCLTEAQAGSAVGDTISIAKPDGDSCLIFGTKIFITAGDHDICENHVHLVLARTPNAPKGFKGLSLFLVPKYIPKDNGQLGNLNDVTCVGIEHKMGIKGSPTCTLSFGEEGKCRGWLIGNEGQGLFHMFKMMNRARIGVGIQSLGLASQAFNYAREYTLERIQGVDIRNLKDLDAKRVSISEHPDIRRTLLWCKAIVEGSRALLYKAAFYTDQATHSTDEKTVETCTNLVDILTPICKAYVSDKAFEVTKLSMQCLGGYGYISEYPIEQHMRDVKIASIYEGTNGIQALDLLGRKLTAKKGALFQSLVKEIRSFVNQYEKHLVLGNEIQILNNEIERWQKTTMDLGRFNMHGDSLYPVLCATPYLEMSGNIVLGWLLLEQAVIVHDKLQTLYVQNNAMDKESRQTLHKENSNAHFYFNKIQTACFFTYNILSLNKAISDQIQSEDRSALNYLP